MVPIILTARWTRNAPFNLFYYAQYCHAIKVCVYHKITSLQFFRLLFSCIFISSKPAKFLDLLVHPQLSNIVIFGEQYMFWSSSARNSLRSHNTCSPFGPHTVFSTSFSDIMKDLPNHVNISEEENLLLWRSIGLNWKIRICILQHLASEPVRWRTSDVSLFICCLRNINYAFFRFRPHFIFEMWRMRCWIHYTPTNKQVKVGLIFKFVIAI